MKVLNVTVLNATAPPGPPRPGAEPAITVHALPPPLTVMRRYELTESGLVRTATEHAGQD